MILREKYTSFIFEDFTINNNENGLEVQYVYKINDFIFKPTVFIEKENITNTNIDSEFLKHLFFNFGIINAINYYKLTCSKNFIIKCGFLDKTQKEFFKKLFYNGLGELLYRNNLEISYDEFLTITTIDKKNELHPIRDTFSGNLIPIGGGKDSIVTLELLREERTNNKCLLYKRNIYPEDIASKDTILTAGYTTEDILSFNVTLDPLMLQLNNEGFYNGHVPFSSCLAFASYIMAYLNNKKYIVLSNEASANESNVKDTNVNHQYSKSFEFEKDFREYCFKYFSPHIEYFSLLRCWNEYQIIKEFLKTPQYLNVFRSCNVGSKTNVWCGNCAKCLYVTIMLYPFISQEKLKEVIGCDMLEDMKYKDILLGLVSDNYDKPFECVGTKEEIDYALKLSIEKYDKLPALLEYYKNNLYKENKTYDVENYFNENNFINDEFLKLVSRDKDEK